MPAAELPPNEESRLKALRALGILDTEYEAAFDDLAELAAMIADVPIALVSFVDEDRQWFKAAVGLDERQTHRDQAFCAHAILDPSQPMIVESADQDPRFASNPLVTGAPHIRFYAGFPIGARSARCA